MKTKPCKYCGVPVAGNFYGYPAICDSDECNEEDRQCEIETQENARWAAEDDDYSLYR